VLEEAVAACSATDRLQHARLLARLAQTLELDLRSADADRTAGQAVALAKELGDPLVLAEASIFEHIRCRGTPDAAGREQVALKIRKHAERVDCYPLVMSYLVYRASDLIQLGRLRECDIEITAFGKMAEERESAGSLAVHQKLLAMRALMKGELALARTHNERAIALAQGSDAVVVQDLWAQRVAIEYEAGNAEQLEPIVEKIATGITSMTATLCVYQELGHRDRVARGVDYVMRDELPRRRSIDWVASAVLLAQAAAYLEDAPRAAQIREWLEGYQGLHAMAGTGLIYMGPIRRYIGLLDAALGRWRSGVESLQISIEEAAAAGAGPHEARLHMEIATILTRHGSPRAELRPHVERACVLSRTFGLRRMEARARALLETAG
jgi:hypothetical protein